MKVLIKKFYEEPIFALGAISVVATGLVAAGVVPAVVGVVAVAIATGLQRQLVKPAR